MKKNTKSIDLIWTENSLDLIGKGSQSLHESFQIVFFFHGHGWLRGEERKKSEEISKIEKCKSSEREDASRKENPKN